MVIPRLLAKQEYLETATGPSVEITGREDSVQPEGVIDIEPYLAAIPARDFQGLALLSGAPPAVAYRFGGGIFDHVLYPTTRPNVFLVIIVQLRPDHVLGHYLLDLNTEYGLDSTINEEL
jgi:hypothetical protein